MTLKLGSATINKLYLGITEIKKTYLGSTLVYDKTTASFATAAFYFGLFAYNSTYTASGVCLKISDGTNTADIGLNPGPSDDGRYWISAADIGASGVSENPSGDYDVDGIYCQKTGLYLSQRTFSTSTNRIKLVLNHPESGKPALVFPGTGDNGLHDNVNDGSLSDIFDSGATFLVHVCNTNTGGTNNRRIWSKGANNAFYYTSSTSIRFTRDHATTDRVMGVPTAGGYNTWTTIMGKYTESGAIGQRSINGADWADMDDTTPSVGARVSDASEKFCLGAGVSGASGHALGGGITTFAIWKSLIT